MLRMAEACTTAQLGELCEMGMDFRNGVYKKSILLYIFQKFSKRMSFENLYNTIAVDKMLESMWW